VAVVAPRPYSKSKYIVGALRPSAPDILAQAQLKLLHYLKPLFPGKKYQGLDCPTAVFRLVNHKYP
jgi:hypothetical protein